jgi:hypothetical protein
MVAILSSGPLAGREVARTPENCLISSRIFCECASEVHCAGIVSRHLAGNSVRGKELVIRHLEFMKEIDSALKTRVPALLDRTNHLRNEQLLRKVFRQFGYQR